MIGAPGWPISRTNTSAALADRTRLQPLDEYTISRKAVRVELSRADTPCPISICTYELMQRELINMLLLKKSTHRSGRAENIAEP